MKEETKRIISKFAEEYEICGESIGCMISTIENYHDEAKEYLAEVLTSDPDQDPDDAVEIAIDQPRGKWMP